MLHEATTTKTVLRSVAVDSVALAMHVWICNEGADGEKYRAGQHASAAPSSCGLPLSRTEEPIVQNDTKFSSLK